MVIAVVAGIVIGANLLDKNSKPAINLNSNSPVTANVVYEPVKLTKDNLPGFLQSPLLMRGWRGWSGRWYRRPGSIS